MSRKRSKSKSSGYIHVNDRVNSERMPVELYEPHVSMPGGGRKYQKDDKSVSVMRKNRAKDYQKHGIGVPGSGSFALTEQEMAERGLSQKRSTRKQRPVAVRRAETARKSKKKNKGNDIPEGLKQTMRELSEKMAAIHEKQRINATRRLISRRHPNNTAVSNKRYTYGLYVLEINGDPYYVYVGQTYLTPEERLEQHKDGIHSARSLRSATKLELRPDLYEDLPRYSTRDQALRAEREYAYKLINWGYRVEGGH